MGNYKLIIAPSSDDEPLFDEATSFDEARQVIENNEIYSTADFEFETERERDVFLQGYYAGIGWNGSGLYWTNEIK